MPKSKSPKRSSKRKSSRKCKAGQVRRRSSGRCAMKASRRKSSCRGKLRNPKTHRCVKRSSRVGRKLRSM